MKLRFLAPIFATTMVGACSDKITSNEMNRQDQQISDNQTIEKDSRSSSMPVEEPELTEQYCAENNFHFGKNVDLEADDRAVANCEAPKAYDNISEEKCNFATLWHKISLKNEGKSDPLLNDANHYFWNRMLAHHGFDDATKRSFEISKLNKYTGVSLEDVQKCVDAAQRVKHAPHFEY